MITSLKRHILNITKRKDRMLPAKISGGLSWSVPSLKVSLVLLS